MSAKEIEDVLRPEGEINVANCLRMLLDPRLTPAGCSILDRSADEIWSGIRAFEPTLEQLLRNFDPSKHGGGAWIVT